MKIDRLLGIVISLLNHNVVSAKALAEKFEVSQRTIQRDMNSISQAGIPITSFKGTNGGYGIIEGYRLDRQIASGEDYRHIVTALKGLCSGYDSKEITSTLEKIMRLMPPGQSVEKKLALDLSVLKEDLNINASIKLIEKAIALEKAVEFKYTNSDNNTSYRAVEPLILTYRWYAWYLFGYCLVKRDYRLFRLSRIRSLILTDKDFSVVHGNRDELIAEHRRKDTRSYLDIKLRCKSDISISAAEAFPGSELFEQDDGDVIIRLRVPENERMWFAALMGFGDKITVLEPETLRKKLVEKAEEIIKLYK